MHKKIFSLVLIALLLLVFTAVPNRASADIKTTIVELKIGSRVVYVNGLTKHMDVAPFIDPHSNRTLVPVRFVAEGLGGEVSWHPYERFVGVRVGTQKVGLWIGKKDAKVLSQAANWTQFDKFVTKTSDQAPEIVPPGRTMIPLRFVSESVGAKVKWYPDTRKITISLTYQKPQVGDVLLSIPFDRGVTNDSGYCIAPGSAFTIDKVHNSLFVYGEKRMKVSGGAAIENQYYRGYEYLFKYDALTGIRINNKLLFENVDPNRYGAAMSFAKVNWLSYNDGYLYCTTPNYGYTDNTFLDTNIIIKKVEPVHMSIVWSKTYNIRKVMYPDATYKSKRYAYFMFYDYDRVPLKFTGDGKICMLTFTSTVDAIFKGKNGNYNFLNLIGIDTKTGNIVWKKRHDGWGFVCMNQNRMPVYKGRYVYLFEAPPDAYLQCNINLNEDPSQDPYYTYQNVALTKLTQKLVKEYHVNDNYFIMHCNDGSSPAFAVDRVVCIDMETGDMKWEKDFVSPDLLVPSDNLLYHSSLPIYLVNGIVYVNNTAYDPGVQFSDDPNDTNFGYEMIRLDALTGRELPLFHRPLGKSPFLKSNVFFVFNYHGTPKDIDLMQENTIIVNNYAFEVTQDTNLYNPQVDPGYMYTSKGAAVAFAPLSLIPLKDVKDAGVGTDNSWKPYHNTFKNFMYRYYEPNEKPKVVIWNSAPNSCFDGAFTELGKDNNIFVFFKPYKVADYPLVYPAIICINTNE